MTLTPPYAIRTTPYEVNPTLLAEAEEAVRRACERIGAKPAKGDMFFDECEDVLSAYRAGKANPELVRSLTGVMEKMGVNMDYSGYIDCAIHYGLRLVGWIEAPGGFLEPTPRRRT